MMDKYERLRAADAGVLALSRDLLHSARAFGKNALVEALSQTRRAFPRNVPSWVERELEVTGIAVLPGFLDAQQCQALRAEVDALFERHTDRAWRDPHRSDSRLYGADRASLPLRQFWNHPQSIALAEYASQRDRTQIEGFTLANRLVPVEGNLGSGGGWHKDSVYGRQFKCLLYLTDVDETNGPFQYVEGSHRPHAIIDSMVRCNLTSHTTRLPPEIVARLVENRRYRLRTVTGAAGTALLVYTTGIHRGTPIEKGCRYALTNYYYARNITGADPISPHFQELFIA